MTRRKIAIILFNLGGPDRLEAVEPFLFNLFSDPAIIRVPQPFRWLIAKIISKTRSPTAKKIYEELGGGSPLLPLTEDQAKALDLSFADSEDEYRSFIAMRYWKPFASDTAKAVKAWGADEIILLPLYPQYSTTTTESSIRDWEEALKKAGLNLPVKGVFCYPLDEGFIAAYAALLQKAIEEAREISPDLSSFRILFSAHGLPKKVIDAGDPYQAQVEACSAAIMSHIAAGIEWRNSYQSRVGPMEWIGPATDDEIKRAGAEGKSLIVLPIAFVSEHSETLVELDIEYGTLAKESGVPHYIRVPAVADHPLFIQGLARLVREAERSEAGIWPENAPGREALEKADFRLIKTGPREKR